MSIADRLREIADELVDLAEQNDSFVLGDFVRVSGRRGFGWMQQLDGKAGKVVSFNDDRVGVEFAERIDAGHDLDGDTVSGHGRWFDPDELELIA